MSIHKAAPTVEGVAEGLPHPCTLCGKQIMLVPGGSGPIWIHVDGHVSAKTPSAAVPLHSTITVTEIEYHDRVRPAGWSAFVTAIGTEDKGDDWTQVLWEVTDPNSPGPYTMFRSYERVQRA